MAWALLRRMGMRKCLPSLVLILASISLSACSIYWGDDDDDCYNEGDVAFQGMRNPENGACENYGGGGGNCGWDYANAEDGARAPLPDWASCPSECEALSESQCLAAERCRAVYTQQPCPPDAICDADSPAPTAFYGCWGIAPSGPASERVACESLDAYECSRHNDCVGIYDNFNGFDALEAPPLSFRSCAAETLQGCYGDGDCPSGWNCTSDTECLPPPGCDPSTGMACPPVCYGRCEPPDGSCAAIDCAPGWHCEETCFPCDSPNGEACPPVCNGSCVPDQNMCPLECPADTQCVEVCMGGSGGGGDGNGGADVPQPVCQWQCVPVGNTCAAVTCPTGETCEMQCNSAGVCQPVCVPTTGGACAAVDCGPGYHCEESCANGACTATCIANQDPGACTGDVLCDSLPPACPMGTVPGIRNGCWTGFCIPESACSLMTPNP
jgi:hypothetical protein